jgi:indole-3-glycerol phosphate synthase
VNNRNLKTFEVDIQNSLRLRSLVPSDIPFVAESGIQTPQDIESLRKANVNAVLIGETLMRASDKKGMLEYLKHGKG